MATTKHGRPGDPMDPGYIGATPPETVALIQKDAAILVRTYPAYSLVAKRMKARLAALAAYLAGPA